MPEHRIRLNRAWEIRPVPLDFQFDDGEEESAASSAADERFDLPLVVDSEPADDAGRPIRLLLTRWFNAPSNLRPDQPLQVVIEPAALAFAVRLNLKAVAPASRRSVTGETPAPLLIDVTDKLQPHNRLDILVGDPAGLSSANIALLIDDQAHS